MMTKKIALAVVIFTAGIYSQAQDFALQQLENSPRHHEWVQVKSGNRTLHAFVAFPEVPGKTPVAIVIHENRGLTEWVRSFADQIAAAGFIAVAPDLLSDFAADKEKTSSFANSDDARNALYQLNPEQVTHDLDAIQEYAAKIKASNGKVVVIGFCWGGSQSFRYATNSSAISAAMVFYGSAPTDKTDISRITAPVYGFYGGNDERINAGIPETEKLMKESGKTYDYVIYPGAGHAYMRAGDDPDGSPENKEARNKSWERIKMIISGL
ncbi:MAG: dienelactone hydrolase family protein [Bacteroidales bacterium]|nr:dienelactone hydrolase family protein [Bacteroidales bacterium]